MDRTMTVTAAILAAATACTAGRNPGRVGEADAAGAELPAGAW